MITQEELKEILNYNSDTGVFTWKIGKAGVKKGSIAGSCKCGYRQIKINYKMYLLHRLAFLYIHGYFPENGIDHINRNRSDNRIENLREASKQCNARNTGTPKNSTSGVKGVCWEKSRNKWKAQIKVNQKNIYLGRFISFNEAVKARFQKEQELNWDGCGS